jgi:hypothetical protein
MKDFKKVCYIGASSNGKAYMGGMTGHVGPGVYVEIKYKNGELSITGVEGPFASGNCMGSCGQIANNIYMTKFEDDDFGEGWNQEAVDKLLEIWNRYHLNHMQPGTPAQMIIIRHFQNLANKEDCLHRESHQAYAKKKGFDYYYDLELHWLKSVNMEFHYGYKFGTKWCEEMVPENILEWLYNLQEAESSDTLEKWFR